MGHRGSIIRGLFESDIALKVRDRNIIGSFAQSNISPGDDLQGLYGVWAGLGAIL